VEFGARREDLRGLRRDRGNVQHDQPNDGKRERFLRHPIRPAREEAAHLIEVADEGESPATLAIVAAAVLAFVVPFAAILIFLIFGNRAFLTTRSRLAPRAKHLLRVREPSEAVCRTDELTKSSNRKENSQ
jgi:hypothetical protein